MFEHYAFGTQVQASRCTGDEDAHISPMDRSRPASQQRPSSATQPSSQEAVSDADYKSKRLSIDSISEKLQKQHIRLDTMDMFRPSRLFASEGSSFQTGLELEVDPRYQLPSPPDTNRTTSTSSSVTSPLSTLPFSMDETDLTAQDPKRLRRQLTTQFNNNPQNTRTIQTLVADMISTGDQCNVYSTTPSSPTVMEPDNKTEMELTALEVDEAYVADGDDMSWMETLVSMRRASGPGGIRKHGQLRYRTSADMALRCANVVRSVPRMRKRRKDADKGKMRHQPSLSTIPSHSSVPCLAHP